MDGNLFREKSNCRRNRRKSIKRSPTSFMMPNCNIYSKSIEQNQHKYIGSHESGHRSQVFSYIGGKSVGWLDLGLNNRSGSIILNIRFPIQFQIKHRQTIKKRRETWKKRKIEKIGGRRRRVKEQGEKNLQKKMIVLNTTAVVQALLPHKLEVYSAEQSSISDCLKLKIFPFSNTGTESRIGVQLIIIYIHSFSTG